MDAAELLSCGLNALGDKAWCPEAVLRVAAHLAQVVNSLKNLSGNDKSELVSQTILKLLDDGEKAEKERDAVSTETKKTTVPWNDCRKVVKTVLPVTLELLVKASRGEIPLPPAAQAIQARCLPYLQQARPILSGATSFLKRLACWKKVSSPSAAAAALPSPSLPSLEEVTILNKDPLAEVRELVMRVEKMLKEAQALPEVKAARLQQNLLLPNPELNAVSLPGVLPTLEEVRVAQ